MQKIQATSRPIAVVVLGLIALLLGGAGYWLMRTAGVIGGGEDVVLLQPAPQRTEGGRSDDGGPGAAASGAVWPMPLDPKAVAGLWIRPNGGDEEHIVLWLLPNGDWVSAAAIGPETELSAVQHVERGSPWAVREEAGPLRYGPQLVVGGHAEAISYVGAGRLVLGPRMSSIMHVADFRLATGETLQRLRTLLRVP